MLVLSVAWLLLLIFSGVDYLMNEEKYRFGTEVHTWRYASERTYQLVGLIEIVATIALIAVGAMAVKRSQWVWLQLVLLFLVGFLAIAI
jgi:hypothetical protein